MTPPGSPGPSSGRTTRSALWLKRRVESPRFIKIEHFGRNALGPPFEIRDESDIDEELLSLAREARAVGDQESG